jgi:hypothetical protein
MKSFVAWVFQTSFVTGTRPLATHRPSRPSAATQHITREFREKFRLPFFRSSRAIGDAEEPRQAKSSPWGRFNNRNGIVPGVRVGCTTRAASSGPGLQRKWNPRRRSRSFQHSPGNAPRAGRLDVTGAAMKSRSRATVVQHSPVECSSSSDVELRPARNANGVTGHETDTRIPSSSQHSPGNAPEAGRWTAAAAPRIKAAAKTR